MAGLLNKRVIFVFTRLELGGAERQGLILARHLKEQCGADVRMVGMQGPPGGLSRACADTGIPCHALGLGEMKSPVECILALIRFSLYLRWEKPNLLISYTRNANVYSAYAWRFCGASGFVWNQADEGLNLGREMFSRVAVALTSCFVSNSSGGLSFLRNCYHVAEKRLHLIHNGVALAKPGMSRCQWRERIGLSDGDLAVGMVANFSRYKDHDTLLKAWRHVVDKHTARSVLLLAGRFDRSERELLQLRDELGLEGQVHFLGLVEDVAGLLSALDIFVYSSRSEGLPNGLLEAMTAGLPVAATDIPGIREALGFTEQMFLSPPGDPAGLANNILRLVNDNGLRKMQGDRLRDRAAKDFSLTSMLKASTDIFASIIDGREVSGVRTNDGYR